jgi:hypothetical protein
MIGRIITANSTLELNPEGLLGNCCSLKASVPPKVKMQLNPQCNIKR